VTVQRCGEGSLIGCGDTWEITPDGKLPPMAATSNSSHLVLGYGYQTINMCNGLASSSVFSHMTLVSNSPLNRLVVVAAAPVYCGVGKYAPAGASVGTDCAADSYSDTPGATSCKPCPAGWTTTGQGETSLSTCSFPAHAYLVCSGGNTTALFDYDGCSNVPCIPGSFASNATTSPSYWGCFMPTPPYIHACFYGTADKENDDHRGIVLCPEPPCPTGTYSLHGRGGTGHTCSPCDAGSYSDTPGATSCKPCPAGKYSEWNASSTCKEYTASKTSAAAAAGAAMCTYSDESAN
jgi:hypothetical protein